MTWFWGVIGFVVVQRLAELIYAARNSRRLLAAGGQEYGQRHYGLFVLLHAGWLIALVIAVPAAQPPNWLLLGMFALLQFGRLWVIVSLGRYWTTRVISVPDAPLVRHGPYRWIRHPNYLIVVLEIAILPAAFAAYEIALVFSVLNCLLLAHRIRLENRVLASRGQLRS